MPSVFFYISGHGFGHSVRQIEIIESLLPLAAQDLRIFVRTSAPQWLFRRSLPDTVACLAGEVDTGVVQVDSLRLDERTTIERAAAFHDDLSRQVDAESLLLREHDARLVVADAPPLACAAAAAAGIPSVVCGNFTWDWIYDYYRDASAAAPGLIARISELYSLAAAGWRLPMHGGFASIACVEDVPLVARHASATRRPEDIREELGLTRGSKLALVSFGAYGVHDLPLDRLDCGDRWRIVITTPAAPTDHLPPWVTAVSERRMAERRVSYPDIVSAMDVVISKPGYGIISDCVANRTPLLYTSRGRFAEYDVMVRDMPALLRCRFISQEHFLAGRWRTVLEALDQMPELPTRPRTDGAQVIASKILEIAGT